MSNKISDHQKLGDKLLKEIMVDGMSKSDLFWAIAKFYSDNEAHAKRMFSYLMHQYFCCSTPINATAPINGQLFSGLPISCFVSEVSSNFDIDRALEETMFISKSGGGIGTLWSHCQSVYEESYAGRNSYGVLPYIQMQGRLTRLLGGKTRKIGSLATFLHISHADIEMFINMRKNIQGIDPENTVPRYVNHAVIIPDTFLNNVLKNTDWDLCNSNGVVVKKVRARDLWLKILKTRTETGEPYIMYEDNMNKSIATHHKNLGLRVNTSNLCTEIALITGIDHRGKNRTAICCLGSVNLFKYNEWKNIPEFFEDIARFYDNILTYFIVEGGRKQIGDVINYEDCFGLCCKMRSEEQLAVEQAFTNRHPLRNAIYSAYSSRDIGIGACGLDKLFKSLGIAWESKQALELNEEMFKYMNEQLINASRKLGTERGMCPDAIDGKGDSVRFSYTSAIAPTSIISYMMDTSKGIEPEEPVFISKNQAGFCLIKDAFLEKILEEKGMNNQNIWMNIAQNGLKDIVEPEIYDIFKGPFDINQENLVKLVAQRQPFISQSQSFNFFFKTPINEQSLIKAHIDAWQQSVKALYYVHSTSQLDASQAITTVFESNEKSKVDNQFVCSGDSCIACQ